MPAPCRTRNPHDSTTNAQRIHRIHAPEGDRSKRSGRLPTTTTPSYNARMEPSFDQMTIDERILHVQALWDRIADEAESVPLSDAQRSELRRRLADHEANPGASIPWEIAREQVRRRR